MAVLKGLTSLSAGVALPGYSLHSHSQILMSLASSIPWWLLSCIFIWRDFICTKTCEQNFQATCMGTPMSLKLDHTSWSCNSKSMCAHPSVSIHSLSSPQLGDTAGLRSSKSFFRAICEEAINLGKKRKKKTDLEIGLMNHPGVVGSCCWQHWLWMSFL